jgi:hypothetical protein
MQISGFAIVPFYVASFVINGFHYYRASPERRLLNPVFGMMFGAIVLMFTYIFEPKWSLILFVVALFWLGLSIYMLRFLPPPRH